MKSLIRSLLTAVTFLGFAASARADMPGQHPGYLHALSDFRDARGHLERPANAATTWDEQTAIREIDAAIHELKEAAIEDGKNIEDHPHPDMRMDWRGRIHKALDLLRRAKHDAEGEEDNNFAKGVRHRAVEHIDAAIRFTEQGIVNLHY